MPRGPGKKENYNLDYSRFNYLDNQEEDEQLTRAKARAPEADAAAGHAPSSGSSKAVDEDAEDSMPPIQELLQGMPPELREAYRLMALSKETGDEKAQRRASELALKAIERGGPQVKQDFIKNISKQAPGVAQQLSADLARGGSDALGAEEIMGRLFDAEKEQGPFEPIEERIDGIRSTMQSAAESTRQQLENLQKQQEQLESLKSPEDIMKFMASGGMNAEDMQRIFSGDTAFMEKCVQNMLDSTAAPGPNGKMGDPEQAIRAAEALHGTVMGTLSEEAAMGKIKSASAASTKQDSADSKNTAVELAKPAKKREEPPQRTVTIPEYRLQYQKDSESRYVAVELKCCLPGVADMSAIVLDVSDEHLRLSTVEPAPGYAVNAGPFPVPIDPGACRAKYSKKREELSITVPVKPR